MSMGSRFHNSRTILEILSFFRFQSSCENAPFICGKGCRPLNHKSDNECECFLGSSEKPCEKLGTRRTQFENFYVLDPKKSIEPIRLDMLNNILLPSDSLLSFWSKTRVSPHKYMKDVFRYLLVKQSF